MNDQNETYIVSTSYYESHRCTIVYGPKVENWVDFCMPLLQIAAKKCLEEVTKEECKPFITTDTLKEYLLKELEKCGYSVLKPKTFNLWGDIIGPDENCEMLGSDRKLDCIEQIEEWNRSVSEELDEEIRRNERG